ncbi:unnamed protein product [Ilex paraguariensis]|uniref:Uncharacterized protein n=1 Tax=Ilex paraguariensis TaxID=185542 RepID=A0ABC8R9Q1_9AQUA
MIYICSLHLGERVIWSLEPLQIIPLDEAGLIDVKLTSNKIWVLKEDQLEVFVADLLFQSSEHYPDDLFWLAHTVCSSLKDQIAPFVSSIFLRRLLLPGVHQDTVVRATFQDYNRHFTDSEFHSLTVDGLKKEILSLIEHEVVAESPVSVLHHWKTFCTRYFHNWCKHSAMCGLLIDSSMGGIGLIRKNSISLFRCLEDIELLSISSFDELGDVISSGLDFSDDDLKCEILFEVLQCIRNVSQQLGKAATAIFYELLLSAPNVATEEVIPRLLKMLDIGDNSSIAAHHVSELGAHIARKKDLANHKNIRKFSTDMFLSLHTLCSKATSWGKVLDVIESYLKFLVPRKTVQKLNSEAVFNINTSITVHATSQIAKVTFESALDILLLLIYLVRISGQIHMTCIDVSRIQLELVPMIQEIVTEWHIIHFLGTTPSESPAIEDFSSQLSSLQIDNNIEKRSWNEKLGKCDFTLAFILLLNMRSSSEDQSLACIPDPSSIVRSVRDFTSWIIWGRTGEESSVFFSHSIDLALSLLKHGQYDAVEVCYYALYFLLCL